MSRHFLSALTTCVLALVLSVSGSAETPVEFILTEAPGPLPVGLKIVQQYDRSRSFEQLTNSDNHLKARPIQTLIWYPALKTQTQSMTVGDYTKLLETETTFTKPALTKEAAAMIEAMKPALNAQMHATKNAPVQAGRFPVVIYAPSRSGTSWENADLCEYLASHGYVVIASPDMGANTRPMSDDLAGVNAQAKDISFLIDYAKTLTFSDTSALAVIGYSWGGISNLFAAARDKRIRALVALDGSMRYEPDLIQQAGDVHPSEMTVPLMFFSQGPFTLEEIASAYDPRKGRHLNPNTLNDWKSGDRFIVHMLGLVHEEFSSMFQRNEDVWKMYPEEQKADYSRADGIVGYGLVARYTLQFLNAYLKQDASGAAFLRRTPADNGAPPHTMQVTFRSARP